MHTIFIFLFFFQIFSFQVAGYPLQGPLQGPFHGPFQPRPQDPFQGPRHGPFHPHGAGGAFSVGQSVKTSSGMILGQPAFSRPEVSEYLGIPFAKPPVKDLRFAPPQAFTGTANINATAFVSI